MCTTKEPDVKPKQQYPPRPWRCQPNSGHVLGRVTRRGGLHSLELYRHGLPNNADPDAEPEPGQIVAVLSGLSSAPVTCDVCGRTRVWAADEEGLRRLLERVLRRELAAGEL